MEITFQSSTTIISSLITQVLPFCLLNSFTMAVCSYCKTTYNNAVSQHQRECPKFIFSIHEYPLTKKGPTTQIERGPDGKIICRCVDLKGIVCAGRFKTQKGLWAHLNKNSTYTWLVCNMV